MSALSPKESGEFIVKNASNLKVHEAGCKKLSESLLEAIVKGSLAIENFSQNIFHPKSEDPEQALNWIFVCDTLNFCFWSPAGATKWRVEGQTGYFALCAAINRALTEGLNIIDPQIYSKITEDQIKHIMRSDDGETMIPLVKERVTCLQEVGKKLTEKYSGTFTNVVKSAEKSAVKLLDLIVSEFPCFRDDAVFKGTKVTIYKRAQILVGDVWACFKGAGSGEFKDIDQITMFADYRVPQVLVHFGALEYEKKLLELLSANTFLENGSEEEFEIRGASIYIVELTKKILLERLEKEHPKIPRNNVNSILIDHFLWDYRRQHADELEYIPFHKTISIYY